MGPLSPPATLFLTSVCTGVASHLGFFKTTEVDDYPLRLIAGFISAFIGLIILSGLKCALIIAAGYFPGLFASIALYRLFFHPLNRFPGPYGARLSKFWTIKQMVNSEYRFFRVLQGLNKEYGDYVRTGPREITVFDSAMIGPMLSGNTKTSKSPLYGAGETTLHMNRDKRFHRHHRKVWDVAMKDTLNGFAPRVEEFTGQLLDRIARTCDKPILLNDYCMFYSYDVMSALAFGNEIGFTKGTANEMAKDVIKNITDGIEVAALLLQLPWLWSCLTPFDFLIKPLKVWNDWSRDEVLKRKKMKNAKPDIMEHLLKNAAQDPAGEELLFGDARLMISAGSDTTGTTLSFVLVHLAAFPEATKKLYEEIIQIGDNYSCKQPQPVLDSILNEVMRLFPPVTLNAPRLVPPEGLTIGDTFMPGGTVVIAPLYAFARDERNFLKPDEFIPERWTTKPELTINKNAWLPFLTGPYLCAGKALAYMELRSVISRVVKDYELTLPSGFTLEKYYNAVTDHAVIQPPQQHMTFTPRKRD